MKKITLLIFSAIAFILVSSCSIDVESKNVYVTVYPLKYMTESLFTDTDLTVGIVPGVTSHEHSAEWSPKQIIAMKDADYLFYIGANYDQYVDKKLNVFESADVQLIKIEEQSDYIQYIEGVSHTHEHTDHDHEDEITTRESELGLDPHFWVSPKRMLDVLELLYDTYIDEYTDYNDEITSNYQTLKANLEELHIDYQETISAMNKPALTSTNLYGYLKVDYGFSYISISPGYHEEPDNMIADEHAELMHEIEIHNINKIIYEKKRTSPASDYIFSEMAKLDIEPVKLQFDVLQALSDDDISKGKGYISVMRENLDVFSEAGK